MKRGHAYTWTDIATTRLKRPKGRFGEKDLCKGIYNKEQLQYKSTDDLKLDGVGPVDNRPSTD